MGSAIFTTDLEDDTPCECGSCDWTGAADELDWIEDVSERISAGEIVPAGECPECGCLAHTVENPSWGYVAKTEKAEALVKTLTTALELAEGFIAGFEGDEMQEGIDYLLANIREAIKGAGGKTTEDQAPAKCLNCGTEYTRYPDHDPHSALCDGCFDRRERGLEVSNG